MIGKSPVANETLGRGTVMSAQTVSRTRVPSERKIPAGRTGKPVRATSRLRRVQLACHGWVRDPAASKGEWIWCEACSDWARVSAVAE